MITPLPQIAPVSDMRLHQNEIIVKAKQAPVILMERGSKPALVCVSPELWNTLAKYVDDLECSLAAVETELAIALGQQKVETVSEDTWAEIDRNREQVNVPA